MCHDLPRPSPFSQQETEMLFAVMGFLKSVGDRPSGRSQAEMNEHLGQQMLQLRLAGPLKNREGAQIGLMVLIEAADFAAAESYLHESPNFKNDLYERVEVAQYALEVGNL
jgi:uncharacterized protein YciI